MQVSLGLFFILTLILFPGLIFRRLYYYGEFSKEFKAGYNLLSLSAISSIPGIIILFFTFLSYDFLFTEIDLGQIIDKFKEINSPNFSFTESDDTPIKDQFNQYATPFIGFLYLCSLILGLLAGRIVRISRLDTKFKLLRFKNYWFYLFNGQHTGFRRLKHLKRKNQKHLFTKADILIDFNQEPQLYSGIVVDYELRKDDCSALSKVILQNAIRYKLKRLRTNKEKRAPIEVPGDLLVVDCATLKNINLTYIYHETKGVLKSKWPHTIEIAFGISIMLLIPLFVFQAKFIDWGLYVQYFELAWYEKILAFLLTVQLLSLFNPFIKKGEEYKYISRKELFIKVSWAVILAIILLIIN